MASNFKDNKPKNVGSIYFNLPESEKKHRSRLQAAIDWLTDNKVMLSISVKTLDGEYQKLVGFFNQYKRDDKKDPDVILRKALARGRDEEDEEDDEEEDEAPKKSKKKARPVPKEEEEDDVEEEEDDEEEEEKPKAKKRKKDDDCPF